jgi:adenylosuccinate synthase
MTNAPENNNVIVIGLGFGDEGKGTITDYIASQNNTNAVVKFSGGAQSAHNVVLEDGTEHTFSQFGAGTLRGIPTLLTEFMMVNPFNLAAEANALWEKTGVDPFINTFISSSALLTTPIHVAANQKREQNRGANAHGSTGLGIGETMAFSLKHPVIALRMIDLTIPGFLETKLDLLRTELEAELGELDLPDNTEIIAGYQALRNDRPVNIVSNNVLYKKLHNGFNVFEGSQGILLDQDRGFHPHTTWSRVTSRNAQRVLEAAKLPRGKVVGVTRSYTTRHGYGPFPSEFSGDEWRADFPEHHNAFGQFQGAWRGGALDLVLLNYAVRVNGGVDEIALTHTDYPFSEVVTSYDEGSISQLIVAKNKDLVYQELLTNTLLDPQLVKDTSHINNLDELIQMVEFATGAPVTMTSHGPRDIDKINL